MRKSATSIVKNKWANSGADKPKPSATLGLQKSRRSSGFTLLEVVLAIAVLASALAAVMGVAIGQVRAEQRLNERFFAGLVAKNVINETRLTERWPALGERSGEVTQGQRRFSWQMRILPTPSTQMRRVDVQVSAISAVPQSSSANAAPIVRLSAFSRQR